MFLTTDKTEWLPPIHSMLTSYGSLNLLDLSRPEHVPFLVIDFLPSVFEDRMLMGQVSAWPRRANKAN